MKNIFSFCLITAILQSTAFGQVGIGTNTPNSNATLELSAAGNKGLLIPRGDQATRDALNINTAKGLMIYDSTTNSIWIHNGNGLASGWSNQAPVSSVAIIPFSSGASTSLTTQAVTGSPNNQALVMFGWVNNSSLYGSLNSNLSNIAAFIMPRNGTITSLAASFTFSSNVTVFSPVIITAQLYSAAPGNAFAAIAGTQTNIIFGPGTIFNGTTNGAISNVAIPTAAQTKLIMVFTVSGQSNLTVSGFMNAGVGIE